MAKNKAFAQALRLERPQHQLGRVNRYWHRPEPWYLKEPPLWVYVLVIYLAVLIFG